MYSIVCSNVGSPALYFPFLLAVFASLIHQGYSTECNFFQNIEFGFDTNRKCLINFQDCSSYRYEAAEYIAKSLDVIRQIEDGTGLPIELIEEKSAFTNLTEERCEENCTEICNAPLGIELRILYLPMTQHAQSFKIIGTQVSIIRSNITTVSRVNFMTSVYFMEWKEKNTLTRWWSKMTSRHGSSYNILKSLEGLLPDEEPHGSYVFSTILTAVCLLCILKPYY